MSEKGIIIFDGECNLCNGVVGWLLKLTPPSQFEFVPFQSPRGQLLLSNIGFSTSKLETVVLIDEQGITTHSDGFIRIISKIPKWQKLASPLAFIPRVFRDFIYTTASTNRVKWFGNSNSCTKML